MRPPCAAEHSAVNRSVVGSSPTGGALTARKLSVYGLFSILDAKTFSKNKNFYIFETAFLHILLYVRIIGNKMSFEK